MGTRVVRVLEPSTQARRSAGRRLDSAGTALMVAISGSVLAATLVIASVSAGAIGGRALMAGAQPAPEPPPVLVTTIP
jgi:hypothetical protein